MTPLRVAGGALLHLAFSGAVHPQAGLLLHRFDRHEAHVGPAHGFADGRGVGCVVLAALASAFGLVRGTRGCSNSGLPASLTPCSAKTFLARSIPLVQSAQTRELVLSHLAQEGQRAKIEVL
jgi:hypothetical protein